METSDVKARYDFAKSLIIVAGELAHGYFRDLSSLNIQSKGLQDVASQADVETEQLIRTKIETSFPADAFFGEETGGIEPEQGQGVWVVDPIDGTSNFVAGIATWCVSIAFVLNGRIQFGLVYDPVHDELFAAMKGCGATLNDKPITPSASNSLRVGRMNMGFSHRSKAEEITPVIDALIRAGGMYYNAGSGTLGLVHVACGRAIGYYEPHINSWDCYGAVAILREAGADVCEAEAGNGLTEGCEIITTVSGVTKEFSALLAATKNAAPTA